MKVKVSFTVDIDAEAWAREYGIPVSTVRLDINSYIKDAMQSHIDALDLGA